MDPNSEETTLDQGAAGRQGDHASPDRASPDRASPPSDPGEKKPPANVLLDRFRLERPIGEGGMGQVWEAWDPRLERRVAIKRLRVADPEARRRFLREARLQATIVHPGICPVFEVGQAGDEPYLVMPCLDGVPLDQAVEGAALEHKLNLMRQVAEAVHAAHGQGLIHRDLKPANILVESPEDAPQRPVVLDFGIARPVGETLSDGRLTASGAIVGTPSFMAPEQVEGHSKQLDRRTDVYALGATLYSLLAGHPPHLGQGASLMLQILREEPARLQPIGIPAEVEAILFKCLEKNKEERYNSALALAEDLQRYLAGEPVQARPITRRVRLSKWLRRHRVAVRVTALAALLSIAALTWGAWSAWRSEERQRLARRFGAQIEEIEALARYSHLVPLHDVRADQAELRLRLDAIRDQLDGADSVVRALAHHALGRGHLALDELETARSHLELAHNLDPDNIEIDADLGRTLSELYRERLSTLERTGDQAGRDSLREQLASRLDSNFREPSEQQKQWQQTLAEPAREFLARGRSPQARDAVEHDALILFHDGKPEAALDLLATAPPAPSWAYERLRLEGNIRRSWAVSLSFGEGTNNEARQQLEAARRTYDKALVVAQSHAALLREDAQAVALLVRLKLVASEEVEPLIQEARQSLENACRIDPEGLQNWLWTTRLELAAADHRIHQATNPTARLAAALEAGRLALELDDQASALWFELGRIHGKTARWQRDQGEDPTEAFAQAADAFDRVALEDRDYSYFNALGILHMSLARHQDQLGIESADTYKSAIAAYRSAAENHSAPFAALNNLGLTLLNNAHTKGPNSQALLNQAVAIFQRVQDLRPDHRAPFYYLGLCQLRLAQGGDVSRTILDDALFESAKINFERAIELAAERFEPWIGLGELFHLRAVAAYTRGDDPTAFFTQARKAHGRALELAPNQDAALLNAAWTAYFQGKIALREVRDPSLFFAEARELCQRSLETRRRPNNLLCLGSVHRLEAEQQIHQGGFRPAASAIGKAESLFREILEHDENHAEAYRSLGRLLTLEAQRLRQMGEDPSTALARARIFLERALQLEKTVLYFHLADARWHLEQAQWLRATEQDFTESIDAGRHSLEQAFSRVEDSREAVHLLNRFADLGGPETGFHRSR